MSEGRRDRPASQADSLACILHEREIVAIRREAEADLVAQFWQADASHFRSLFFAPEEKQVRSNTACRDNDVLCGDAELLDLSEVSRVTPRVVNLVSSVPTRADQVDFRERLERNQWIRLVEDR